MNILYLSAHSILEYDEVRLFTDLGHDVFSPGAYIRGEGDGKRPALDIPIHHDLITAMEQVEGGAEVAKTRLPDAVMDWTDTIICSAFEHTYLVPQWDRIRGKRVIWRTIGQSVAHNEAMMAALDGLEIVRYSPKERNIPGFAGESALIRFYKDPADYGGWTGEWPGVINITQHLYQRSLGDAGPRRFSEWTNYSYWEAATRGLQALPLGPGSEAVGGPGTLSNDDMVAWLRKARCYLYTGTQPASYTLGLIEAMMVGIPVVSIGPEFMDIFPYDLFEGRDLVTAWHPESPYGRMFGETDDPAAARHLLTLCLNEPETAAYIGRTQRERAIELFGRETIAAQWADYLR